MKLENSNVSILEQKSGIEGMLKHIETVGRVCYASQDRITEDSYDKFLKNVIIGNGHWAALELGTVYLKVKKETSFTNKCIAQWLINNTRPFTRYNEDSDFYYITTNYRIINQALDEDVKNFMYSFFAEPDDNFKKRVTVCWECARVIATEFLRHRSFSPMGQSTRYCNFSKGKFNNEITVIIPEFIKKIAIEKCNIDLNENPEKIYEVAEAQDVVSSRIRKWKESEWEYMYEIGLGIAPEDARGILPFDLKTILYQCGYVEDFYYNPPSCSVEKAGFFNLRSDQAAHKDARVLSKRLEDLFKINNIK